MFFRTMFKINRYLQPNKNSLLQYGYLYKSYRNHTSKAMYAVPSAYKHAKLSSTYTRNLEQRKSASLKMESTAMTSQSIKDDNLSTTAQDDAILKPKIKPLSIEEQKVQGLQPSSMPNYYTSNMSNLSCFPEEVTPIRRKFEKSSTQNALTMPFKLARLANPFPEPVKTQMSNTVSDEEKSMQMQEEAKMEARYRMQQQQEVLVRQQTQEQQQRKQQMQDVAFRKQQMHSRQQEDIQAASQEPMQENLHNEPAQMRDQKNASHRSEKKQRTRASRYLRNSRNPRTQNQERKYSSDSKVMHPEMLSDIEQCELILQRLKSLHPDHKFLKRPVCIPGSQEEKEFVKATLKYIAKHKNDLNRRAAPFPSYSEVKTFVREPKIHESKFGTMETTETSSHKELLAVDTRVAIQNRKYATKQNREDICATKSKDTKKKICTKLTVAPCAKPRPTGCTHVFSKDQCKKTEAPYPSYSECCDDGYEDEPSECKICPLKADIGGLFKEKKKYSTSAAAAAPAPAASAEIEAQPKSKKEPCENPCKPPPCDYAETARRNKARKGQGSKGPIKKPKKNAASPTMFEKIRKVFETPEEEKPLTQEEPREIHVIELADSTIMTSKNIPGFMSCDESTGCFNKNKGCPPQKKKKDKAEKEKKKCRQKKKRPLPTCEDAMKNKKKKAMELPIGNIEEPPFAPHEPHKSPAATTTMYEQIHVNDEMRIVEPMMNIRPKAEAAIEATTTSGSSPFKLKQQYWKVNK